MFSETVPSSMTWHHTRLTIHDNPNGFLKKTRNIGKTFGVLEPTGNQTCHFYRVRGARNLIYTKSASDISLPPLTRRTFTVPTDTLRFV